MPLEPELYPISAVLASVSVPPPEMVSVPVALLPTVTVEAEAVSEAEIVGPEERSIVTVLLLVGTRAVDQLPAVSQSELVLPVHVGASASAGAGASRAHTKTVAMMRHAALCKERQRGIDTRG